MSDHLEQKKVLRRMTRRQEDTRTAQQRNVTGSSGGILSLNTNFHASDI